jgi:hypothetical protein
MLYKIGSMGYFGGVAKVSRGPWFRDYFVEDDGLDWFYTFLDNDGNKNYLLSNNMAIEDRERMSHMYHTMLRNNRISWFAGLWLGFEACRLHPYTRSMALGWRFTTTLALGFGFKSALMAYSAGQYNPVVGAYLRKYSSSIKQDLFDIKDAKKEYFYIDTSQYMNTTNDDLSDEFHVHHGPQPEGESMDSSWLTEVDKFLRSEENNLKGHKRYLDYDFEFIDKSFPSAEKAAALMHGK